MRKLHPLSGVRNALASATQLGTMGLFLGMAGASTAVVPAWVGLALAPLGVVLGVAYGVARYLAFEYALEGSTLHITSGVFRRQNREIPASRVQTVDVRRGFVQRLLGLAVVRFETAGGGQTEAVLRMVDAEEAERLQRGLARAKRDEDAGGPTPREPAGGGGSEPPTDGQVAGTGVETTAETGPDAPAERSGPGAGSATGDSGVAGSRAADDGRVSTTDDATRSGSRREAHSEPGQGTGEAREFDTGTTDEPRREVLFELSTRDLAMLSGLRFRLRTVPLVLFALPFGDALLRRAARRLAVGGASAVELGLVLGGLVTLVLVAWLLSAVVTFLSYYDFRLARVGDELRYERGLVQRYSGAIPLAKVQSLSVTENVLMRWFGYAALTVETAGYAAGGRSRDGGFVSRLAGADVPSAVPLADREAVRAFVAEFEGVDDLAVDRPPSRARRRYAGRYVLVALGATALLVGVDRLVIASGWLWAAPLALLAVAPVAAHLRWRHRGYRTADRHLLTRTGFWRRTTQVVPYYRVQAVVVVRTVFQRRWDLASVVADTAASGNLLGREAVAHDRDDGDAEGLHERLRERLRAEVARRRDG